VPFREAHEAVGGVVGFAVAEGRSLDSLSRAELQRFHAAFPGAASDLLDLERSFAERSLAGGTARATVAAALDDAGREIDAATKANEATAKALGVELGVEPGSAARARAVAPAKKP
jgi:hypothetical protein